MTAAVHNLAVQVTSDFQAKLSHYIAKLCVGSEKSELLFRVMKLQRFTFWLHIQGTFFMHPLSAVTMIQRQNHSLSIPEWR